jgi:predicted membrane-bound spermidine synthase
VLVLGGGDGLALREVFKYREVRRMVLVDFDPQWPWPAATRASSFTTGVPSTTRG